MMNKSCCFTGHRPEKLTITKEKIEDFLAQAIAAAINDGFRIFITGMARGVDLWAAQILMNAKKIDTHLKLVCAIPYAGFEKKWSRDWQCLYRTVLESSDYTKVFYPSFSYSAFETRNRWMVEHSTRVIAVYSGNAGGTRNTIDYANKRGTELISLPG